MDIADNFRVSTPIDATWKVLLDIEGIAPCLPGAQLQEVDGNEYRGIVKVKVGPITAQYKGTATLTEVNEAEHKIVLDASGRDTRGQGNANATIVVTMNEEGDGTRVDVVTDLSITGKVAQFGRGVLDDVSSKLLRQFVENLERDVLLERGDPTGPRAGRGRRRRRRDAPASTNGSAAPRRPGPRLIHRPKPSRSTCSTWPAIPTARRLVPIVVGVVALFLVWRLLRAGRGVRFPAPARRTPASNSMRSEPRVRSDGPVLGIDPGLSRCGYGIVARERNQPRALGCGVIRTPPDDPLPAPAPRARRRAAVR